jgi:AcrR family transcriptional regulator
MVGSPGLIKRPSRKSDIVEAFAEMVAQRGYDAVSVRDVAEALGISKGTILHHFRSKDRILEQVHADYMRRRIAEADLILARLVTPADQLAGLIYQNLLGMESDYSATVAFAREISRFATEEVMSQVRAMRREYRNQMRSVLERGMEQGAFRRDDVNILSLQIFGMFNWSWTWLRREGEWTSEHIAATFVRTILHGLIASGEDDASHPVVIAAVRAAMSDAAANAQQGSLPS